MPSSAGGRLSARLRRARRTPPGRTPAGRTPPERPRRIGCRLERLLAPPGIAAAGGTAAAGMQPVAERARKRGPGRPPPRARCRAPGGAAGIEATVLAAWRDAFGIAEIAADDDFFALGGNSLTASAVVTRLRGELRLEFPIAALFAAPSVREFSAELARLAGTPRPRAAAPASPHRPRAPLHRRRPRPPAPAAMPAPSAAAAGPRRDQRGRTRARSTRWPPSWNSSAPRRSRCCWERPVPDLRERLASLDPESLARLARRVRERARRAAAGRARGALRGVLLRPGAGRRRREVPLRARLGRAGRPARLRLGLGPRAALPRVRRDLPEPGDPGRGAGRAHRADRSAGRQRGRAAHHPARIAEEWAVVDNISRGRVGISFAAGWHPADFVFAPDRFEQRSRGHHGHDRRGAPALARRSGGLPRPRRRDARGADLSAPGPARAAGLADDLGQPLDLRAGRAPGDEPAGVADRHLVRGPDRTHRALPRRARGGGARPGDRRGDGDGARLRGRGRRVQPGGGVRAAAGLPALVLRPAARRVAGAGRRGRDRGPDRLRDRTLHQPRGADRDPRPLPHDRRAAAGLRGGRDRLPDRLRRLARSHADQPGTAGPAGRGVRAPKPRRRRSGSAGSGARAGRDRPGSAGRAGIARPVRGRQPRRGRAADRRRARPRRARARAAPAGRAPRVGPQPVPAAARAASSGSCPPAARFRSWPRTGGPRSGSTATPCGPA